MYINLDMSQRIKPYIYFKKFLDFKFGNNMRAGVLSTRRRVRQTIGWSMRRRRGRSQPSWLLRPLWTFKGRKRRKWRDPSRRANAETMSNSSANDDDISDSLICSRVGKCFILWSRTDYPSTVWSQHPESHCLIYSFFNDCNLKKCESSSTLPKKNKCMFVIVNWNKYESIKFESYFIWKIREKLKNAKIFAQNLGVLWKIHQL